MEANNDEATIDRKERLAATDLGQALFCSQPLCDYCTRIGGHGNCASKSFEARAGKQQMGCSRLLLLISPTKLGNSSRLVPIRRTGSRFNSDAS